MSDFDGKVAIVTGGGSGLGEAISKELATKGARVIVSDINSAGAERVRQEITDAGGTASAFEQDTARPADSETVVRHAVDTYGGLHLAVNNPGIGGPQGPPARPTSRPGIRSSGSTSTVCFTGCAIRSRRCCLREQNVPRSST